MYTSILYGLDLGKCWGANLNFNVLFSRILKSDGMKNPLVTNSSPLNVKDTADKLEAVLRAKGIQVFARIDHAGAAKANGLTMADEELLIFGDPKIGTHLMQECAAIGIELPLKILIWQEEQTKIAYRDQSILISEYEVEVNREILEKMSGLLRKLVSEVIAP